jgi:hypothetical protein
VGNFQGPKIIVLKVITDDRQAIGPNRDRGVLGATPVVRIGNAIQDGWCVERGAGGIFTVEDFQTMSGIFGIADDR